MIIRSIPFKQNSNCLRCGKNSLLTDQVAGEQFCANCGYVISEKSQESGPEWRSFSQDQNGDRARTGSPTSLTIHDRGLSTVINPLNKDATGKPLSASMKSTITRLRTWDSRSQVQTPADRNLRQALNELNGLKDKLMGFCDLFRRKKKKELEPAKEEPTPEPAKDKQFFQEHLQRVLVYL